MNRIQIGVIVTAIFLAVVIVFGLTRQRYDKHDLLGVIPGMTHKQAVSVGKARRQAPSLSRVRNVTWGGRRSRASLTDPSNRMRPPATMAMRSHNRSAWAMTWVEKRMVTPLRA